MVCQLIMHSNVIVGITISRGSFVFSQSRVKVSASLANVGSMSQGKNVFVISLVHRTSTFAPLIRAISRLTREEKFHIYKQPYKDTNDDLFDDFPKSSEDSPNVVRRGTREKRSAHACLPCFRRESSSSTEAALLLVSTKNRDLWLHSGQTTGHSREHARD